MTLRQLWHGCIFTHQEPIWESDHFRCLTCNEVIPVLPQKVIQGPAHTPERVRGQATGRAVAEAKVTKIKRGAA